MSGRFSIGSQASSPINEAITAPVDADMGSNPIRNHFCWHTWSWSSLSFL